MTSETIAMKILKPGAEPSNEAPGGWMPPDAKAYFFSKGQVLLSSGVKASSAGMVASSL